MRCNHKTQNGTRCRRNCCGRRKKCWQHGTKQRGGAGCDPESLALARNIIANCGGQAMAMANPMAMAASPMTMPASPMAIPASQMAMPTQMPMMVSGMAPPGGLKTIAGMAAGRVAMDALNDPAAAIAKGENLAKNAQLLAQLARAAAKSSKK